MYSQIDRAIGFAARAHKNQKRKTSNIPYIAHPVGVAMILLEMGCDESFIIGGLLHDTVEDTTVTLEEVEQVFGAEVAQIVDGCTEPPKKQLKWEDRKKYMIRTLRNASLGVKLVTAADKYHNLCHTRYTLEQIGSSVWQSFGRNEGEQAWYYRSVYDSIVANLPNREQYPIFDQLEVLIKELFQGVPSVSPQ